MNKIGMVDRTILKGLFCRHYSEMIHLARTLLYDEVEAEDVVQDVFLRIGERPSLSFGHLPHNGENHPDGSSSHDDEEDKDKMRAYLMASVRNGCLNRIRQMSLTKRVSGLYAVEVESDVRYSEERLAMLDAVCDCAEQHLEEPHRTIFRLRFEQGMKLKEIAQQLDMNLKTVFKYLSLSIQRVQKEFKTSGETPKNFS